MTPVPFLALPDPVWVIGGRRGWKGWARLLNQEGVEWPRADFAGGAGPRPGRLTDSAARTDVVLLIRRTVRPTETLPGRKAETD